MPGTSAQGRSYHSPRREAQARATRRHILDSARRLFVERGYTATTVPDVAREAEVSTKTIYLSFPNKRLLLVGVWDLVIGGADDQVPVAEREWYREMVDEPDPGRQLDLMARNYRVVKERAADVMEVVRGAAAADPELAELWSRMQSEFHDNQRALAIALSRKGGLRPGLTLDEATDLLWTLNHPNLYHLLVVTRSWPPARYEQWLATTLRQQLLGPPA